MTATTSQIASRAAAELLPGQVAYFGPGLPALTAEYLPSHWGIVLLSDDGALTSSKGTNLCILEQSDSAGLVRGGYVDVAVLQAGQVSVSGDFSDQPGAVPGLTRPAEVGSYARRVVAVMELATGTGTPCRAL